MKIANLQIWLLAASLLLGFADGGATVDGSCNMGKHTSLEGSLETKNGDTDGSCENS